MALGLASGLSVKYLTGTTPTNIETNFANWCSSNPTKIVEFVTTFIGNNYVIFIFYR